MTKIKDWEKEFDGWAKSLDFCRAVYDKNTEENVCPICGINTIKLKQFIKDLIDQIEKDVVGGEYSGFDIQSGDWGGGYNQKRQELIEYFKKLKDK